MDSAEVFLLSTQVRLMNVTAQGNSTLIRWNIFPAGSSNAMSNATAMVASTVPPFWTITDFLFTND